jgi:hypothetical protein
MIRPRVFQPLRPAICLFVGWILLFASQLKAKEPSPQEVGMVLKLKGKWLLNEKTLAAGEKLPAGGKIYHAPLKSGETASPDYISVVFFDGRIETRSWDNTQSWNEPIQLPTARNEAPSRWSRIVNAVMGVFPGHPERYTQMSVRGSALDVADAVVDLNDGKLDLSSAFKRMKKGQYRILLEPIQHSKTTGEEATPKPVVLDWESNTAPPLQVEGVRLGLYRLVVRDAQSSDSPGNRSSAWVLVSEHGRYESTAAAFQECVSLTEKWAPEAADIAGRSFCRAYLDSLVPEQTK